MILIMILIEMISMIMISVRPSPRAEAEYVVPGKLPPALLLIYYTMLYYTRLE